MLPTSRHIHQRATTSPAVRRGWGVCTRALGPSGSRTPTAKIYTCKQSQFTLAPTCRRRHYIRYGVQEWRHRRVAQYARVYTITLFVRRTFQPLCFHAQSPKMTPRRKSRRVYDVGDKNDVFVSVKLPPLAGSTGRCEVSDSSSLKMIHEYDGACGS